MFKKKQQPKKDVRESRTSIKKKPSKEPSPLNLGNRKQLLQVVTFIGLFGVGLISGMLIQSMFFGAPITDEASEDKDAKIEVVADKDCNLIINETFDLAGIIVDTDLETYENLTGQSLHFIYGVSLEEKFLEDLKDISKDEDSIKDVKDELEKEYKEEEANVYTTVYPTGSIYMGLGITLSNLLSDDLTVPNIDLKTGEWDFKNNLFDGEEIEMKRDIILSNIIIAINLSVWYDGDTYEHLGLLAFSSFLELNGYSLGSSPPEESEDLLGINHRCITLQGDETKWEMTELYCELYDDSFTVKSATFDVNGNEIVLENIITG